jgi:hypothetical protein
MQKYPEVTNFKSHYNMTAEPNASEAYTATSSSTRLNVTLVVPNSTSEIKASPVSVGGVIAK